MRKLQILLIALAGAAVPATASAQTPGGFEFGAEVFDYDYRERFEGETIVFDDGKFGGLHASYVETIGGDWLLRARLSVGFGSVDYRAPDPAGDVRLENVNQSIGQLELHVGRDFRLGGGATLTPFLGIGSRVLNDNSGGHVSDDDVQGYDRQVSYAYVPFGVGARVPLSGRTSLVLNGQYNWFVGGDSDAKFSRLDPELPDVKVDLNSGRGFEASASVETRFGGSALRFGPFLRHWTIGESESFVVANPGEQEFFIEPPSRTTEIGLRLSFAF